MRADAPQIVRARSKNTAATRPGRDLPTINTPSRGQKGRSVVPKAATQGDDATKPAQRHFGPSGEADPIPIHKIELLEAPAKSAEMLRARSGEWFQRMQKEAIGIRRRPEP